MTAICHIFKDDDDRWCLTHDGASAWSDSMAWLETLAKAAGYEVSYRHPGASVVLDHALCDSLRSTVLDHVTEAYAGAPDEATGLTLLVGWMVEHYPELARLAVEDLAGVPV